MDFNGVNQSGTEFSSQLKILVVDDDVLSQRMMRVLLTREGHQVDTASSGGEALERIKLRKYDIVFMDLQMPMMDGIESSRLIRKWENGGDHTFIVALTASYLPEQGQELFEAGIDNYIAKPFELEHIQRLLNYSIKAGLTAGTLPLEAPARELPPEQTLDIQQGIAQVGGDSETYEDLLSDFVSRLPERIETIQHLFAEMELTELSRAAHNLQGVAANLGASQLSEYARKLDRETSKGYTESIAPLLQEIQIAAAKVLEFSNNFLAKKKISVGL